MPKKVKRESLQVNCSFGFLSPHAIETILAKFGVTKAEFLDAKSKFLHEDAERAKFITAMPLAEFSEVTEKCFHLSCEPVSEESEYAFTPSISNQWLSGKMTRQRVESVRFLRRPSRFRPTRPKHNR
ncbi:MAG TPA: hypothetical protein VG206_03370 [Terriglobia bacterium]|nr:hypothetical protein [Terriglobia bacterium]